MANRIKNIDSIQTSSGTIVDLENIQAAGGGGNTFKDLEIQGSATATSQGSTEYTVTGTTVLSGIKIVKFHVTMNGGSTVTVENGVTTGFVSAGTGSCPVTVPFNAAAGTNFVISATAEDELGNVSKEFTKTVNIVANVKPTAPTAGTFTLIFPNDAQTSTFTGSTDANGGSVVSYRVKNISASVLSVDADTVTAGSAHTFRLSSQADVDQYWTNNSLSGNQIATFDVVAVDNLGLESDPTQMQIEMARVKPVGEASFTTSGTYLWAVPANVLSVCVVCVGGGGGRLSNCYAAPGAPGFTGYTGGGGLGYKNNIPVTEGETITVVVGAVGPIANDEGPKSRADGGTSWFKTTSTCNGGGGKGSKSGGGYVGDGGGNGGGGGLYSGGDGGGGSGAGGYSGDGGEGSSWGWHTYRAATDGAGGGGSGGWGYGGNGRGGGVGLYGQGANGNAPTQPSSYGSDVPGNPGSGGSGANYGGAGANGAVRIMWGDGRSFPNNAA